MTEAEAIYCLKVMSEYHSEVCEECPLYGETGTDHCYEDTLDIAINALETVHELKKRGMTMEVLENYVQFEDECVKKGFTFKSILEAREKQIAKKVIIPHCNACENELCDCECEHFGKTFIDDFRCPACDSEKVCIAEYDIRHDYCPNCGQKLDWSEV